LIKIDGSSIAAYVCIFIEFVKTYILWLYFRCVEEVVISKLLFLLDRKTGEKKKTRFVKQVKVVAVNLYVKGRSIKDDRTKLTPSPCLH